jgi:hypothetical protein
MPLPPLAGPARGAPRYRRALSIGWARGKA